MTGNPKKDRNCLSLGSDYLTYHQLSRRSASFFDGLPDEWKKAAGSRIVLLIHDNALLMIAMHAVMANGFTCIPVDPSMQPEHINLLMDSLAPQYCIAEGYLAEKLDRHHQISIVAAPWRKETFGGTGLQQVSLYKVPLLFASIHKDGTILKREIPDTLLQDTFERLDTVYDLRDSDTLLLFDKNKFHTKVLDMLWGSCRGITIVIRQPEDITALDKLLPTDTEFSMDFGLFYFGSHTESLAEQEKYRLLIDSVKYADENDFTCVWTPERHFNEFGGLFPNPSVLSAALAMVTQRIQLRSGSLISPLHHSVRIAEDWSVVDNLSSGRVAISFGSGWQCNDFSFFPERYEKRHEIMYEQIAAVKNLWTGGRKTVTNGLGSEVDIEIFPKPVQPELPIWVTVSGKTESFVDAGRIGANILTHLLWQDTDELIGKIRAYRDSLELNGYDPGSRTVSLMTHTFLGTDNDAVKQTVRPFLKEYIKSSVHLIESMSGSNLQNRNKQDVVGRYGMVEDETPPELLEQLVDFAFERFFEKAALLGTVQKTKALVKKLKGYGVDEIACLIDFGLPNDVILDGLRHLNELRQQYDKHINNKQDISLLHCSADQLAVIRQDPDSTTLLNGLRRIGVDHDPGMDLAEQQEDPREQLLSFSFDTPQSSFFNVVGRTPMPPMEDESLLAFNAPLSRDF